MPEIGRWRGSVYCAAVGTQALVALAVVVALGTPVGLGLAGPARGSAAAGAWVVAGLALLGLGLPCVAIVLARLGWNGAAALLGRSPGHPFAVRLRELRTLTRPLAYAVVMVTIGGVVALVVLLLVIAAVVALLSPWLTAGGDEVVIGPVTLSTTPQSVLAAVCAVGLLTGLVSASSRLARVHCAVVLQLLTSPEQRLQSDLTATVRSRARLVRAFDVERRRIERDLHDGVQPQLMSISMTLGLALATMPPDAPGRSDVMRAQHQAKDTLEALRRFVRNIHPQVLIDHGLGAAVGELADTLPISIRIEDRLGDRLPAEVETNLYFCVAELLTNVVKHSGATHTVVRLGRPGPRAVEVVVEDDGHGGAGIGRNDNSGLDGIADRVAALDGTLGIDSPLGGPTVVAITVTAPEGTVHD